MFNSVQFVREVCKQRKIPISLLEKDCGFANGYLNPKKLSKLPYDRALVIADYLHLPVDVILTGETKKEQPTVADELPDHVKALMEFAKTVPEEKAEMILRVMKSILESE